MKTKRKGKAIIGIVMAAIMLASVLVAMVPTVSTVSIGGNFNYIGAVAVTEAVLVGQNVQFNATGPYMWTDPANVKVQKFEDGVWYDYAGPWSGGTVYNVNWDPDLTLRATNGTTNVSLSVQDSNIPLSLKVGTKVVTTIAVGTTLTVDTSGINLFPEDRVDLVVNSPMGVIVYDGINDQQFRNISVSDLINWYRNGGLKTTGWEVGDYTFQIKTKSDYACGLDAHSVIKDLTITTGEINITAEKTFCVELQIIKLTVTGVPGDTIWVNATPSSSHVLFVGGVEDTPAAADGQDNFAHIIDENGKRTYAVEFNDTGSYTIKVTVKGGPRDGDDDTVDITVSEKGVTFDMPTTVVIGERLTVRGTANTGDWVQIAVDDLICTELRKLVIAGNGEFEKEIDTSYACSGAFSVPGSVRLKAFIDTSYTSGQDVSAYTDDGSMAILMLETHLNAILSKAAVPPGDSFEVYGDASSNYVEIVAISPKGGNGTGMEGLYGVSIYTVPTFIAPDAFSDSEIAKIINVSECSTPTPTIGRGGGGVPHDSDGGNFYKKIEVDRGADTGNYVILVLSPGMDGIYGDSYYSYINSILDLDGEGPELGAIDVSNKTKEEIVAIIEDIIYATGSDDFMWIGNIVVTQFVSVTRDLPDAPVSPEENFNVSLTQSVFYITGSVTETLPEGFKYRGLLPSSGGELYEYDETTNELTLDFDSETTITYVVKAGTAEQIENAVFYGTWATVDSQMNIINGTVTGDITLTLATPAIEADPASCIELEMVKLTVTGVAGDEIRVESSPLSPHVIFKKGIDDTPTGDDFHGNWFNDTIDADGVRRYAVEFNDTGTYTIKVTVTDSHGAGRDGDYDTVDITVSVSTFDTGSGTYPSIFGTHNGTITITPHYDINVSKMYTYSCPGTGGHTEYVAFYNATTEEEIANGSWNGYHGAGDYHYIEFDSPFVLQAKVTYNYTIRTGSYPQIIHAESKDVIGGIINCTKFVDANGKEYNNWIPAIRLE